MKKIKIGVKDYIFLGFVVIGAVFLTVQKVSNNKNKNEIKIDNTVQRGVVKINKNSLTVEIVSSEELRSKGLSNVENMSENEGMLFVNKTPGRYTYSMRDMKFDLDFIFINNDRVVDIAKGVSYRYNGTIKGEAEYDKILEVNADWVNKNKVKIGDLVVFDK